MKRRMRIYISGPITGTKNYLAHFAAAEKRIKELFSKSECINPAKILRGMPDSTTWDEYMRISMELLEMSEAIWMLENWRASSGASMEYGYARGRDMIVLNEHNELG